MARRELPALWILLAVLGVVGAGLGVGHWRRAWPELAARAELLDRAPAVSSATSRATPVPRAAPDRAALDINRASVEELASLPGVTRTLAKRVVATRAADGPFPSLDDLARVRGFGARRLERLRAALVARP